MVSAILNLVSVVWFCNFRLGFCSLINQCIVLLCLHSGSAVSVVLDACVTVFAWWKCSICSFRCLFTVFAKWKCNFGFYLCTAFYCVWTAVCLLVVECLNWFQRFWKKEGRGLIQVLSLGKGRGKGRKGGRVNSGSGFVWDLDSPWDI